MDRPIFALLDEIIRATEHCKRESRFLEDKDLFLLFSAHVRMKIDQYEAAMRRQETRRAEAPNGAWRVAQFSPPRPQEMAELGGLDETPDRRNLGPSITRH